MQPKAIIFDVDGTIANSERWGHLPACNEAFKILSLPIQWDWPEFRQLLRIPGNANRLYHVLSSEYDFSQADIESYVEAFVKIKKELYITKYLNQVQLRSGIKSFIDDIIKANIRLAIVSTSYESQIKELLDSKLAGYKSHFNPILGKESGIKTGDGGVLYQTCLKQLALAPEQCLVIEDSKEGFQAAQKAGIPTAIFSNDYTADYSFEGAVVLASSVEEIDKQALIAGKFKSNLIPK